MFSDMAIKFTYKIIQRLQFEMSHIFSLQNKFSAQRGTFKLLRIRHEVIVNSVVNITERAYIRRTELRNITSRLPKWWTKIDLPLNLKTW